MNLSRRALGAAWMVAALLGAAPEAPAQGVDPYTITQVKVEAVDVDASQAKHKAFAEAQMKAFRALLRRIADEKDVARLGPLDAATVGRLLNSISVESEQTAPKRYLARLTVRFRAEAVRQLLARHNIAIAEDQARPLLVVPLWRGADSKPVLWGAANPWAKAWGTLDLRNSVTPVVLAPGDPVDVAAISAEEALAGNPAKLDALKFRHGADNALLATAQLAPNNAIRVIARGETPSGRVDFDRVVKIEQGNVDSALAAAADKLLGEMEGKWKWLRARPYQPQAAAQSLSVSVAFASLGQWNEIRGRLVQTPGISGVDIATLAPGGAVVKVAFAGSLDQLRAALQRNGFALTDLGGTWVLQPN
jgi:hypothetical protein